MPDLREQRDSLSFSAIASQLGYPKYASADDDPLRLLARLPLSIYITTSGHDFMERALADEGRRAEARSALESARAKL